MPKMQVLSNPDCTVRRLAAILGEADGVLLQIVYGEVFAEEDIALKIETRDTIRE